MKRIFISKNEDDLGDFGQFCEENKLTLIAKSLITFEAVDFKLTSPDKKHTQEKVKKEYWGYRAQTLSDWNRISRSIREKVELNSKII